MLVTNSLAYCVKGKVYCNWCYFKLADQNGWDQQCEKIHSLSQETCRLVAHNKIGSVTFCDGCGDEIDHEDSHSPPDKDQM